MKAKITISILSLTLFLAAGCVSLVDKQNQPRLDELEQGVYTIIDESVVIGDPLKKGLKVKLIIMSSPDWVKVYAYPEKEDKLNAKRTLILYMFKDEFPEKKFDTGAFEKKLFGKVK